MAFIKKLVLSATALTLSFAVHTANYYFYTDGRLSAKGADAFVDDVASANDENLKYLFPYVPKESLQPDEPSEDDSSVGGDVSVGDPGVPSNMNYSAAEFSKFKGTYLEKASDAGAGYFDNIVFCGDSLTYGLGIDSRYLKAHDVIAWGGLGVYDYLDYTAHSSYNQSEETTPPIQWLQLLKPEVLYIMLGTNGIAIWSNEKHIRLYNNMLDRIDEILPDTDIVLVGIPPWGESRNTETFNGQKFDAFNMLLLETAHERGYYYLNFPEVTRKPNGNIKDELVIVDGIHWQNSCKELYLEYIRTHAIKK